MKSLILKTVLGYVYGRIFNYVVQNPQSINAGFFKILKLCDGRNRRF